MDNIRPITFLGDSLNVIRDFASDIKKEFGYQLDRVQRGFEPDDWKPMKTIGMGIKEIRVRDKSGAYRVIYIVKHVEGVFVLHAFKKKTERTSKHNIEIAKKRYFENIKSQK